jgi:Secretion system C-terminal sorting domain
MPGPKMIWQFGELGYDYPINYCVNGTIDNACRLDRKPIRWDYKQQERRQRLYDIYSSLNKLRYHGWYKDIFTANNIIIDQTLNGAIKTMRIRSATDSSQIVIVGNFDVQSQTGSITFPTAGTWYDYLRGNTFAATGTAQSLTLQPGEFHLYLNRNLTNAVTTPVIDINNPGNVLQLFVYPNPVDNNSNSIAEMYIPERGNVQMDLWNAQGQKIKAIFAGTLAKGKHTITLSGKTNNLSAGIYLLKVQTKNSSQSVKVLVK